MPAIDIKNLNLSFGARNIFHDFNATVENGEFIGIFGSNGAGKSTLLRTILGLVVPNSGTIQVLGKPAQRGNSQIGYLSQTHNLLTTAQLSGKARLRAIFSGFKWGLPLLKKPQRQIIDHVIHLVAAEHYADRPFGELSGGERQRLFLAQALLNQPKILLLDEPLSNLDPRYQEELIELVQRIRRELKVTVLFTAHDLNPLLGVMDRIIYLAQGNAAIGTVDEVVTTEKLSWLYGTPIEVIRHQQRLFVISQERGAPYATHDHHYPDAV